MTIGKENKKGGQVHFQSLLSLTAPHGMANEEPVIELLVQLLPAHGQRALEWPWTQAPAGDELRIPPNKTGINLARVLMHGNEIYLKSGRG